MIFCCCISSRKRFSASGELKKNTNNFLMKDFLRTKPLVKHRLIVYQVDVINEVVLFQDDLIVRLFAV
jgi:hypothetical protein